MVRTYCASVFTIIRLEAFILTFPYFHSRMAIVLPSDIRADDTGEYLRAKLRNCFDNTAISAILFHDNAALPCRSPGGGLMEGEVKIYRPSGIFPCSKLAVAHIFRTFDR